jgi:hypothetical protein
MHKAAALDARSRNEKEEAEKRFRAALQAALAHSSLGMESELADVLSHLAGLHGQNGVFRLLVRAIEDARSAESTLGRSHAELADRFTRLGHIYAGVGGRIGGTSGGYGACQRE